MVKHCFTGMSQEVEASLSSDMRLLYRCAKAVVNGDATNESRLSHGKLCMARWHMLPSKGKEA